MRLNEATISYAKQFTDSGNDVDVTVCSNENLTQKSIATHKEKSDDAQDEKPNYLVYQHRKYALTKAKAKNI